MMAIICDDDDDDDNDYEPDLFRDVLSIFLHLGHLSQQFR